MTVDRLHLLLRIFNVVLTINADIIIKKNPSICKKKIQMTAFTFFIHIVFGLSSYLLLIWKSQLRFPGVFNCNQPACHRNIHIMYHVYHAQELCILMRPVLCNGSTPGSYHEWPPCIVYYRRGMQLQQDRDELE